MAADPRDALPHMTGEFVDGNRDHFDAVVTENALGEFVAPTKVIENQLENAGVVLVDE